MNFQNKQLPAGAVYAATSPVMTEQTVLKPILKRHMAPRGKCGLLTVSEGSLQFVWDDTGEILDAAPGHPIVIEAERFHHVAITGPVTFQVAFYSIPAAAKHDAKAVRPGERFIRV